MERDDDSTRSHLALVAHGRAAIVRLFALLGSLALVGVEIGIRSIIFAIPVALVARWCDVQPTWKSMAFLMFFCFWYDCAFGGKDSARQGNSSAAGNRKAAAIVMTPAQVAAEARKLGRRSTPGLER
jgi:hypothetical protein